MFPACYWNIQSGKSGLFVLSLKYLKTNTVSRSLLLFYMASVFLVFLQTFCFHHVCSVVLLCRLEDVWFWGGIFRAACVVWAETPLMLNPARLSLPFCLYVRFCFCTMVLLLQNQILWWKFLYLSVGLISDTRYSHFLILATDYSWLRLNLGFFHMKLIPFPTPQPLLQIVSLLCTGVHSLWCSAWLGLSCVLKQHITYSITGVIQEHTEYTVVRTGPSRVWLSAGNSDTNLASLFFLFSTQLCMYIKMKKYPERQHQNVITWRYSCSCPCHPVYSFWSFRAWAFPWSTWPFSLLLEEIDCLDMICSPETHVGYQSALPVA